MCITKGSDARNKVPLAPPLSSGRRVLIITFKGGKYEYPPEGSDGCLVLRTKASVFGVLAYVLPRREAIAMFVFVVAGLGHCTYIHFYSVIFFSLFHSLTDSLTH